MGKPMDLVQGTLDLLILKTLALRLLPTLEIALAVVFFVLLSSK